MRTCKNCYWYEQCADKGVRCEYYEPILHDNASVIREYLSDLKERAEEYDLVVREQQGLNEEDA